ncbi:PfkB family carbohydrate kinase [Microbacterium sp.]|uniref:PfkB family carbohydrate kinase n=1 Tax=Microbacterium sp. TaxID=51671 RepID=UPI0028127E3A|nr:PfkB family carbohydrate kinase [Microbacterium sp.]
MRTDAAADSLSAGGSRAPRVIHTGQALVDLVVEVPDLPARGQNVMATSVAHYAGGAVTVLLAAARLGAECVHAGAHGTGPNGDLIRAVLAADGITAPAPPVVGRDTGLCIVAVEPTAERTFLTTLGAERDISVDGLATAAAQPGDLICVTGYSLAVEQTREPLLAWMATLPEAAVVVLDPGAAFATLPDVVRDVMLARTDVWTSNAEEATDLLAARSLTASASDAEREISAQARTLAPLLRDGAVTIVRDGAAGCAVHVAGETAYVEGFPQTPIDTNGAGDTHTGALLAEIARHPHADAQAWADACRRANAAAAIKVTRRGPDSAPTAAEVDDFLSRFAAPAAR